MKAISATINSVRDLLSYADIEGRLTGFVLSFGGTFHVSEDIVQSYLMKRVVDAHESAKYIFPLK